MDTQHFTVQGMTCGHCEGAVRQAIRRLDAQAEVQIERSSGRVSVRSASSRPALAAALTEAGYPELESNASDADAT
jgi:copper chaperone